MRTTPLLAALLMLGGVSGAYAQEGPSKGTPSASESGSSATQERGSGRDAGATKGSENSEQGGGASSKRDDNDKDRSAEKNQQPNEKSTSGRAATNESNGKKSKSSAKSDGGDSKRMGREGSDKSAQTKEGSASDKTDRSATDPSKGTTTDRATEGKPSADKTDRSANDTSKGSTKGQSAEGKRSADKAKHVDLTGDKRIKVQTAFRDAGTNVKHHTDVNIDITVGRRLPRDWGFVPVPVAVIDIVPEYRDYYFAYVEDEYVIVEPDTYEVVAVLPAERSQAGASSGRQTGGQCSAQLSLTRTQQQFVLDNIRGGREADVSDISVGRDVPRGVELQRFPQSVLTEATTLEGCQYFDAGDQIAIVNPDENKIVLVIDKG